MLLREKKYILGGKKHLIPDRTSLFFRRASTFGPFPPKTKNKILFSKIKKDHFSILAYIHSIREKTTWTALHCRKESILKGAYTGLFRAL